MQFPKLRAIISVIIVTFGQQEVVLRFACRWRGTAQLRLFSDPGQGRKDGCCQVNDSWMHLLKIITPVYVYFTGQSIVSFGTPHPGHTVEDGIEVLAD